MAKYLIDYSSSCKADIKAFYDSPTKINFKDISLKKQLIIRATSIYLNEHFNKSYRDLPKNRRYTKLMDKIRTNFKEHNIENYSEMYLLFMFSVDPNFEALLLHEESNNIKETKSKMIKHFGIYDYNLIKLEMFYMNILANEKLKENIKEKIKKRVYGE